MGAVAAGLGRPGAADLCCVREQRYHVGAESVDAVVGEGDPDDGVVVATVVAHLEPDAFEQGTQVLVWASRRSMSSTGNSSSRSASAEPAYVTTDRRGLGSQLSPRPVP
jgi:hypothetical protein